MALFMRHISLSPSIFARPSEAGAVLQAAWLRHPIPQKPLNAPTPIRGCSLIISARNGGPDPIPPLFSLKSVVKSAKNRGGQSRPPPILVAEIICERPLTEFPSFQVSKGGREGGPMHYVKWIRLNTNLDHGAFVSVIDLSKDLWQIHSCLSNSSNHSNLI